MAKDVDSKKNSKSSRKNKKSEKPYTKVEDIKRSERKGKQEKQDRRDDSESGWDEFEERMEEFGDEMEKKFDKKFGDKFGEEFGDKVGKKIEKKFEDIFENSIGRGCALFFIVVWNGLMFMFVNVWYQYISFITADFVKMQTIFNISIFISLATHFTKTFIREKWYDNLTNLINNSVSIVVLWNLINVFPFDFTRIVPTAAINPIVKFGLGVAMICVFIAIVVEGVKFVINIGKGDD